MIPSPEGHLRAGMFLTVTLLKQDVVALMIPEQALMPERTGSLTETTMVGTWWRSLARSWPARTSPPISPPVISSSSTPEA